MTLKFAIAGAGYIAAIHAEALQRQKSAELVAVVEKFPEKRKTFARKFGIQNEYETVADLLKDGGVDALIIGTPNALHAPQAIAALLGGVHVMVEKPMAVTVREAEKMIAAGQKSGASLMVAHCWRFDKEVRWLKFQAGKLGQIIRTKGYGVHVQWGPEGWFTQKKLAGGGALADMGIHALDTARFLLGDPRPISVYARLGTYYRNFDVDDTGVVLVNWEGGACSYIESGWWQPHADGPEAATQLYGLQGFGQLFPTCLQLGKKTVDPGFPFPRPEHGLQSMYDDQVAYFVKCIRSGSTPIPGGAEGLVNMQVIDAAYQSARTGKAVFIHAKPSNREQAIKE
jgi:predicted dehydrogenase